MDFEEVMTWLETNKEDEKVKQLLAKPSLEDLLKSPEGQKLFDSKVSLSINTFREKTLPQLVEAEKKKLQQELNPSQSPEMAKIKELEQRLAEKDKSEKISSQRAKAIKVLSEKGIPAELADYVITEDDEETNTRVNALIDQVSKYGQSVRESVLKGHSNVVPQPSAADNLKKDSAEPPSGASKEQLKDYYRAQATK